MKTAMLGLLAETPVHPGSGRSMGVVDLPVAREAATDNPILAGSSLKGALRDKADAEQRDQRFGKQDCAANALKRINELRERDVEFKKPYRRYVDRLGPAIVMNGLGQALAAERAAAGPHPSKDDQQAHHELYMSLNNWLCRQDGGIYRSGKDLLEEIMGNDEDLYLHAHRRTASRHDSSPFRRGRARRWPNYGFGPGTAGGPGSAEGRALPRIFLT